MIRKIVAAAAAVLACSGAMATTLSFDFNTQGGTKDAISFSGALDGSLTFGGWGVVGATGFTNFLLDGSTTGVSFSNLLPNGSYENIAYSVLSPATHHTVSYTVANFGVNHDTPIATGAFDSVVHQSTPIQVNHTPVPGVPEPETYAMMLAGLGALGFMGRRRKTGNQNV